MARAVRARPPAGRRPRAEPGAERGGVAHPEVVVGIDRGMAHLDRLPARDEHGNVVVVVEAPRGSRVKLEYAPKLGVITLGRPLPLGLHYPSDWGFVPSTRAADGDPIDALVLHDVATHPGVIIRCTLLGVVKVQERKQGKTRRNDRLICVPSDAPRFDGLRSSRALPKRTRDEIEQFFLSAVYFMPKEVQSLGWGSKREASALLDASLLPETDQSSSLRARRGRSSR